MKKKKIAVIGSYAVGATISCEKFPVAGQTVPGKNFSMMHGGKGSNQAITAGRMGAEVVYATCIGEDSFGAMCLDLYEKEGIDSSLIKKSEKGTATGVGLIYVNAEGENEIVIGLGANNEFLPEDIDKMLPRLRECEILLMQLEMPLETVLHAARVCHREGITFVLNPAPYQELPQEIYELCDYITPNQTEARQMLGLDAANQKSDAEVAGDLLNLGVKNIVMTCGEDGALYADGREMCYVPGYKVKAVDTTGAGDTFSGAFVVALAEGKAVPEAIRFANAAAALAVTKYGVVESIPTRDEVDKKVGEE